jgi:hypothetical protein
MQIDPAEARRANSRCGSLEEAALNELVAQLVEQRPFNPNLAENRRLGETSLWTYNLFKLNDICHALTLHIVALKRMGYGTEWLLFGYQNSRATLCNEC